MVVELSAGFRALIPSASARCSQAALFLLFYVYRVSYLKLDSEQNVSATSKKLENY